MKEKYYRLCREHKSGKRIIIDGYGNKYTDKYGFTYHAEKIGGIWYITDDATGALVNSANDKIKTAAGIGLIISERADIVKPLRSKLIPEFNAVLAEFVKNGGNRVYDVEESS